MRNGRPDNSRQHFDAMTPAQKRRAIRNMASLHSVHTIAAVTGLAVEQVRRILAETATA